MATAGSFFACATVDGIVYMAGGHEGLKNTLRSAYGLLADEWVSLQPMSETRYEGRGLSLGSKFWAVSGYSTEGQGRFAMSTEWYDLGMGDWARVEGTWDDAMCASCFGLGEATAAVDLRGVGYERSGVHEDGWEVAGVGSARMVWIMQVVWMNGEGQQLVWMAGYKDLDLAEIGIGRSEISTADGRR